MAAIGMGGAKVKGLAELRRELKKLDDAGLTDELKAVNMAAAQTIIGPAKAMASGLGRMEARAAATLKASRAANAAKLLFGGASAPFAGGAEFGAGQNIRRNPPGRNLVAGMLGWNQFNPWRGNGGGAGYFLYPTIRAEMPTLIDEYGDALERITAKAFPD
jgi:hypothetical protein